MLTHGSAGSRFVVPRARSRWSRWESRSRDSGVWRSARTRSPPSMSEPMATISLRAGSIWMEKSCEFGGGC